MNLPLRGLFILAAVLTVSVAAGQAQAVPPDALIAKARSLEARGRADLAAQAWQQVLLSDPNNAEALAELARYARQNGRVAESKAYLERLRRVRPGDPAISQVESMPVLAQHRDRLREAERLAAAQQFDQAMRVYREVFGDNPPPGAYAIAYYETEASVPGGWEAATAGLQKLVQKYPDSEEYRFSLGRLWTYRPETRFEGLRLLEGIHENALLTSRARQAWRQALVWERSNPQAVASMRAYVARYPDEELEKIVQQAPAAHAVVARNTGETQGYAALKANSVKEAEAHFEAALRESPHSPGALAGMGYARMKENNFASAVEYFEAAAGEAPQDKTYSEALETARFWKTMNDATSAFNAGKLADAASLYRQAATLRADSAEATEGLAGALMKLGDWTAAAPVVEKLVVMKPGNEDAWRNLVNARYRSAGPDAALAATHQIPAPVQQALAKNVDYLLMLSAIESDLNKNPEASTYLEEAVDAANVKGRQLSISTQLQFAGLYLRLNHPGEAATVFERVTDASPGNLDAWEGLLASLVQIHDEGRALRCYERMAKATTQQAMQRPAFLRSLASIQMWMGHQDEAEILLRKSIELDTATETRATVAAQLQLAYIWLQRGAPKEAEALLRQMVATHPDDSDVWKALIAALHQEGRDQEAIDEDTRIPTDIGIGLRSDPDYVTTLAASENAIGHDEEALHLVRRAINLFAKEGRTVPAGLQIQLAWLLLNTQRDQRELYTLLQQIGTRDDLASSERKDLAEIWSTWTTRRADAAISAGDTARGIAILEAASRMLPKDNRIRAFLGGALLKSGDSARALAVYKSWGLTGGAATDYCGAIGAALAQRDRQAAAEWLRSALARWPNNAEVLTLAGKEAAATGNYEQARKYWRAALAAIPTASETASAGRPPSAPSGAAPDPSQAVGELLLGGDVPAAQVPAGAAEPRKQAAPLPVPSRPAVVTEPMQSAPEPQSIRHASNGTSVDEPGPPALPAAAVADGLDGSRLRLPRPGPELPPATDGAVLRAEAEETVLPREEESEDVDDSPSGASLFSLVTPDLLGLTPGTKAAGATPKLPSHNRLRDDSAKTATRDSEHRSHAPDRTSVSKPISSSGPAALPGGARLVLVAQQSGNASDGSESGGASLPRLGSDTPAAQGSAASPADSDEARPARRTLATNDDGSQVASQGGVPAPDLLALTPDPKSFTDTPAQQQALRGEVQDDLEGIQARNSPYIGTGGDLMSRSGQPGFDQLVVEQVNLQTSMTIGGRIRVIVDALPTYLDAGTATGESTNRFGLLPAGATFGAQSVGGIGGDVQISTPTFGLIAGSTPRNFLVPNFTGGIRFQPAGGPITFLVERDNVEDSMLAYAGARDPVTNRVWGGVIADSFSILGKWGGTKQGIYASFGYQSLTGMNVESNNQLNGNAGAWWSIRSAPDSSLTLGFNVSGMHYDHDLRYFTLGQGGYFSPQQYLLFNVPVRWRGVYKQKIVYSAVASFGAQHFVEDSSPYFPTLAVLQGQNGPSYPALVSTGPNYGVDLRIGYQLSPYWYLGGWADFNNARDYDSESAGVSLIYSPTARPVGQDASFPTIPDWRGNQPFGPR